MRWRSLCYREWEDWDVQFVKLKVAIPDGECGSCTL